MSKYPEIHEFDGAEFIRCADFDRVTAERDAALVDVERLDNALNVTDAAATKWLSELTKARELFELILDDPRLVVAMSSNILVPIKSLLSGKPETFESKVSALQQRLTAADERADMLEGLLQRVVESSVLSFEQDAPESLESLEADICAALKPAQEAANCKACDGKRSVCVDWDSGAWAECAECAKP